MCVAVSADQGLEHFEIITGGMTEAKFINFLQVVSGNFLLDNGLSSDGYCIFDNAPPHSNVENEEIPGLLSIKRLPKNSPMLTIAIPMTENAISAWKQGIKRSLSIRMHEFTKPAPAVVAGRTLTQNRIDKMSEIIRGAQGEVTFEKCRAWYDHALTYIPDCLEKTNFRLIFNRCSIRFNSVQLNFIFVLFWNLFSLFNSILFCSIQSYFRRFVQFEGTFAQFN